MRATVVAGVGGLIIGHMLWLLAISFASATTTVNAWVIVIGACCALLGLAGGWLGRTYHRRKAFAKAAFLWCLPISPVLLSLIVLGVTYV